MLFIYFKAIFIFDYVDDLNGKPLDWYNQQYFIVVGIHDNHFILQDELTKSEVVLEKKHLSKVLMDITVGSEIAIFKNPETDHFVSALLITEN
jgi:hypothetical protein